MRLLFYRTSCFHLELNYAMERTANNSECVRVKAARASGDDLEGLTSLDVSQFFSPKRAAFIMPGAGRTLIRERFRSCVNP